MKGAWKIAIALAATAAVVIVGLWRTPGGPRQSRPAQPDEVVTVPVGARDSDPGEQHEGSILGDVFALGPNGRAVPGAVVRVRPSVAHDGLSTLQEETDGEGRAAFGLRRAGRYFLRVAAAGYAPWTGYATFPGRKDANLSVGAQLDLEVESFGSGAWKGVTVRVMPASGAYRDTEVDRPLLQTGQWEEGVVSVRALLPSSAQRRPFVTLGRVALAAGRTTTYRIRPPKTERTIRLRVRGPGMDGEWRDAWSAKTVGGDDDAGPELERVRGEQPHVYSLVVPRAVWYLRIESFGCAPGLVQVPSRGDGKRIHQVILAGTASLSVRFAGNTSPRAVEVWYQRNPSVSGQASFAEGIPGTSKGELVSPSIPNEGNALSTGILQAPASRLARVESPALRGCLIAELPAGAAVVVVGEDDGGMPTRVSVVLGKPGTTQQVVLDWAGLAILTLRVVDGSGAPLAGAFVDFCSMPSSPGGIARIIQSLRAGEDGRVTVRGLERKKTYLAKISHFATRGLVQPTVEIPRLLRKRVERRVVFPDEEATSASVEVLDGEGQPVSAVPVVFAVVGGLSRQVWTNENGVATVRVAKRTPVLVRVIPGGGTPEWSEWFPPENLHRRVDLDRARSMMVVRIRSVGGADVSLVLYRGGKQVARERVRVEGAGVVRFPGLISGNYRLVCSSAGKVQKKSVDISGEQQTLVDVAFVP